MSVDRSIDISFDEPVPIVDSDLVGYRPFDVAPDGGFVAIVQDPDAASNRLQVVFDWFEELNRLVPPR